MSGHLQAMTDRTGMYRCGFSLIELIVVVVITAILAAVAVPAMGGLAATRAAAAARQLVRDLSFARERSLATGATTWVSVNASTETYTMLQESVASPGRSGAAPLTDPSTGRNFSQSFAAGEFAGVEITSVSIGGGTGNEVGFDWKGRPKDQAEVLLSGSGAIMLTAPNSVTIQPETGLAKLLP